ncbi:hypothetical protein ACJX0J_023960, partial [Zea mays]
KAFSIDLNIEDEIRNSTNKTTATCHMELQSLFQIKVRALKRRTLWNLVLDSGIWGNGKIETLQMNVNDGIQLLITARYHLFLYPPLSPFAAACAGRVLLVQENLQIFYIKSCIISVA